MELTYELGEEVINRLREHLEVPMNLMNKDGVIVASTDHNRIGQVHGGGKQVINDKKEVILHPETINNYPGTKPGVNLPMYHFKEIIGVVGITGHPDQVYKAANITKAAVEIAVEQIYLQRQLFFQESSLNNWLQQLFHPLGFDENKLKREAEYMLKIPLNEHMTVFVVETKVDLLKWPELTSQLLFKAKLKENEVVCCLKGEITYEHFENLLMDENNQIRIGIGNQGTSVSGIRSSYFQAKQALLLSKRSISKKITHIEDWNLERLIVSLDEEQCENVLQVYESKLRKMGLTYLTTLQTFFDAHLQIKVTSERLHIHRNTLMYRLGQIKEKTGLDPRSFYDSMLLYIICFQLDHSNNNLGNCTNKSG